MAITDTDLSKIKNMFIQVLPGAVKPIIQETVKPIIEEAVPRIVKPIIQETVRPIIEETVPRIVKPIIDQSLMEYSEKVIEPMFDRVLGRMDGLETRMDSLEHKMDLVSESVLEVRTNHERRLRVVEKETHVTPRARLEM